MRSSGVNSVLGPSSSEGNDTPIFFAASMIPGPMALPSVLSAPPAATTSSVHAGTGWASTVTQLFGTTWLIEGEHLVEGPSRCVTLGEWLDRDPTLAKRGDERGVPVLLVVHRSRLNPWRDDDCGDSVAGAIEGEAELSRRGDLVGRRNGSGRDVVVGAARLIPADQQGGVPDIGARRSGHGPIGVVDALQEGLARRASTTGGRSRCRGLHR